MSIDYTAEFYKLLKPLMKEIVEKYPDNLDQYFAEDDEQFQEEWKYIQERLKAERMDHIFKRIMNKDNFYALISERSEDIDDYKRRQEYFIPNFSFISKQYQDDFKATNKNAEKDDSEDTAPDVDKDDDKNDGKETFKNVIWELQRTGAKYEGEKSVQVTDRSSYCQFIQLMDQIDFSESGKQIFQYSDSVLYFNALVDNGEELYRQQNEIFLSNNGFMVNHEIKDKHLYSNALKKSNLQKMHEKLRKLLRLSDKTKDSDSIQEMDIKEVMKAAKYLSDLVPVVDKDFNLKNEKQLKEERISLHFFVLKFFMEGKYDKKPRYDSLKEILIKYFEIDIFFGEFLEKVCDSKSFNDEQMLVITKGYLDSVESHFDLFSERVIQYQKMCEQFQGNSKPLQMYKDIWDKVWENCIENE